MKTTPYAARFRAARAYANLNREPVAEALRVSLRTLSRLEAGELPSSVEQRRVVAEICGVPEWFLEHGFEGATLDGAEPTLRDEVEAVRHELTTLRGQQRESREEISSLGEEVRRLQLGIVEAVAEHVEDAVSQLVAGPHDASDASPRDEREAEQ